MRILFLVSIIALQLVLPTCGDYAGSNTQLRGMESNGRSNNEPELWAGLRRSKSSLYTGRDVKAVVASATPCTEGFEKPSYRFSGFQFNKTTAGAGERSMTRFQLHDIANNGSTSCTTPYLQDPNKPAWNNCDRNDDGISPKTTFKYTASANELEISQMWICEVQNKTYPHPYFSSAKIDLTELLDCVNDATQTICTVVDGEATPFSGDYVIPAWKSGGVDIIPPSQNAVTDTPWNPSPCIGPSFSYPNWDVQNFSFDGSDSEASVSFRLYNHATNESVTCTVQEGEWSSCGDNSTGVRFVEGTSELSVNQTWICNAGDRYEKNVTFRAVGSVAIDAESTNSTFIKGSLMEPIEMTPNVAPEGVNHAGCLETSDMPSWIVTSWVWNEKWRNGYNSGDLTATFYNPSTGFNLTCTGDGEELNRDGRYGYERWWGCALARSPFDDYRIISMIKLNPITEVFSITQTWYCNGKDGLLPSKFKAVGDVNTTLECSWKNDTSANTSIKTCYQTELPLTLQGNVTERTELPQDVFFEMAPTGYSCTIASVLATQWRTTWSSDTLYANPTFASTLKTKGYYGITFMALDGFQSVDYEGVSLTPFLPTSEPGRWYDCKNYDTEEDSSSAWARNSIDCKWQLDLATGYFAINHTWFCDDKDPEHPIIFEGSGSRFYDFSCYVHRDDDEISCNPTGLNPPPVLPTYLSWKSVPAAELKA
ncbi:hypothetical protein F4677DRAFT_404301 [Hypoxylon crocopeplum]|nr:hypothetical protein F4677DRAFT_404301 [Hypoxylon crocopeplum]